MLPYYTFFFFKTYLEKFRFDFLVILVDVLLFKDPDQFFPNPGARKVDDPQHWVSLPEQIDAREHVPRAVEGGVPHLQRLRRQLGLLTYAGVYKVSCNLIFFPTPISQIFFHGISVPFPFFRIDILPNSLNILFIYLFIYLYDLASPFPFFLVIFFPTAMIFHS